jgi:hypothetical protein
MIAIYDISFSLLRIIPMNLAEHESSIPVLSYPLAAPPVASSCIRAAVAFLLTKLERSRFTSRWITAGRIFDTVGTSDSYVVRDSGVSTTRILWPSSSSIVCKEVLISRAQVLSGSFTRLQESASRWPNT